MKTTVKKYQTAYRPSYLIDNMKRLIRIALISKNPLTIIYDNHTTSALLHQYITNLSVKLNTDFNSNFVVDTMQFRDFRKEPISANKSTMFLWLMEESVNIEHITDNNLTYSFVDKHSKKSLPIIPKYDPDIYRFIEKMYVHFPHIHTNVIDGIFSVSKGIAIINGNETVTLENLIESTQYFLLDFREKPTTTPSPNPLWWQIVYFQKKICYNRVIEGYNKEI